MQKSEGGSTDRHPSHESCQLISSHLLGVLLLLLMPYTAAARVLLLLDVAGVVAAATTAAAVGELAKWLLAGLAAQPIVPLLA